MKFKIIRVVTLTAIPVLLFGFQNCAKLGTNGIAVDGKVLTLDTVDVVSPTPREPANETVEEPGTSAPPSDPVVSDHVEMPQTPEQSETPPVVAEPAEEDPIVSVDPVKVEAPEDSLDMDDSEVVKAIELCGSQQAMSYVRDLNLKFNHEQFMGSADGVSSIKGNMGNPIVVRASSAAAKVEDVHVNHSTLVLCKFQKIQAVKGTFDKIIVVEGHVEAAQINNSTLVLVNATLGDLKGAHAIIKRYSLK